MNKNIIIKEALLAKPTGNFDSGYILEENIAHNRLIVEFENVKTETCVIDVERGKAISIETREIYDCAERDEMGRITSHEITKIKPNEIIALRLMDKEWNKISLLYQINLKARAKQVFDSYMKIVSNEESEKVYTKRGVNK